MAANDNNIPGMAGCLVAALYTDSLANKVDNAQGFVAKQATFTTAMMMSGVIHSQCMYPLQSYLMESQADCESCRGCQR